MQSTRVKKRGISFLEFIGCLTALSGGVVLGSMYLGVDMKSMAIDVLEQSQLVDTGWFGSSTPSDADTAADAAADADEFVDERSPVVEEADGSAAGFVSGSEKTAQVVGVVPAQRQPEPVLPEESSHTAEEFTDAQRQQATRAYWNALATCMQEEAIGRQAAVKDSANWQLFDFLKHRYTGHQHTVEFLEQLEDHGVDQKVTSHAKQVLTWHLAGSQLYSRAVDLLTDGPTAELSGPIAQSWQSAATQHRMEEKLVREKHVGVAGYLDHTYKSLAPFKPAAF